MPASVAFEQAWKAEKQQNKPPMPASVAFGQAWKAEKQQNEAKSLK